MNETMKVVKVVKVKVFQNIAGSQLLSDFQTFFYFQLVLCKGGDGKIGLRVKAINKGIFVCLVTKNSPSALGGLRFYILFFINNLNIDCNSYL